MFYFYIDCDKSLIATNPIKAIYSKGFFTKNRLMFTIVSAGTFIGFTALFYRIYGYEFLYEGYIYHLARKDHRHNNSVYWLMIYQLFDEPNSTLIGLLTFIPQWSLLLVAGFLFYYDLIFAFFIQTYIFVTMNKVMTAQYFLWHFSFFPAILINCRDFKRSEGCWGILKALMGPLVIGALIQAAWGYYAYNFEHGGENTFE